MTSENPVIAKWPPAGQQLLKEAGTTEPRELPCHRYDEDRYEFYIIVRDTEEGRAYDQLATDDQRHAYMRAHAHESWSVVQCSGASVVDGGKEYRIGRRESPEAWKGMRELEDRRGPGSVWKRGLAEL